MEVRDTDKAVPWQRTEGQSAYQEGSVTGKAVYPEDRL